MNGKVLFGIQNIFSLASRERCMTNLKKLTIPRFGKIPGPTAAIMVPLCRVGNVPCIMYTVRASVFRSNNGEILFPGGKSEDNETPVQTALRKTQEDIGLLPKKIEVWGEGTPVPSRNHNILITPVIASIAQLEAKDLKINAKEVSEVFTVPVEMLCDPRNQFHTQYRNGYILPVFIAEQYKIWGMTAYITHTFLSAILSKDVYRNDWMKKKITLDHQG